MDQKDNNWWNDFFESDLWARVHTKTKTPEQTLQEIEFVKKVSQCTGTQCRAG